MLFTVEKFQRNRISDSHIDLSGTVIILEFFGIYEVQVHSTIGANREAAINIAYINVNRQPA